MITLPPIGSDDHDRAALTRTQMRTPVEEGAQEDGGQGEDEGLTGTPPAHEPTPNRTGDRRHLAPGAGLVDGELLGRER